ncbi:MAG: hypothetical protein LAT81_01870 [Oceanicaulis sp.]|nr:hypothetical protein [Oceanicaulis sp.]
MIRSGFLLVLASALAAALSAPFFSAQAQEGEAGFEGLADACIDFSAFSFDLFEAGAVLAAPARESPDARADAAVFADGSVVIIAADFCVDPAFQVTARFPAPQGPAAARERLSWLFAAVDSATGCNPGGDGAAAVDAAAGLLGAGRDIEPSDEPFHETDDGTVYLAVTLEGGQALASLVCEDYAGAVEDAEG